MKVKFQYEAYWSVRAFSEELAVFNAHCQDYNVITTSALAVTPDDDPGEPYAWLALVRCDCEFDAPGLRYDDVNEVIVAFFEVPFSDCTVEYGGSRGSDRYAIVKC